MATNNITSPITRRPGAQQVSALKAILEAIFMVNLKAMLGAARLVKLEAALEATLNAADRVAGMATGMTADKATTDRATTGRATAPLLLAASIEP